MKRRLGYRQSFRSLRTAKTSRSGIGAIRTINRGHAHNKQTGVTGDFEFIGRLFEVDRRPEARRNLRMLS
ncbi:MAG: hypothetical protein AAF967_12195 [Pseudomonadota bacterium]